MSSANEYLQGYNAEVVANGEQVVEAASVTDEQNDMGELDPMIEGTEKWLAESGVDDRPGKFLADARYCSEENPATLHDNEHPDVYVAARNMERYQTPANLSGLGVEAHLRHPQRLEALPSRQGRTVGRSVQPDGRRDHLLIDARNTRPRGHPAPSGQSGPALTSRQLPAAA